MTIVDQETIVVVTETPTEVVTVDDETVTVTTSDPTIEVVTVGSQGPPGAQGPVGPQGPQGVKGDTGDVGGNFVYPQLAPAAVWTITHGLGFHPSVSVVDSAGSEVFGDVRHIDANTVEITFAAPFAGTAYFS